MGASETRCEAFTKEIDYRREKRWRIFSWASSILLAALGGVIALTGKGFQFTSLRRTVTAVAVISICLYALYWISMNRNEEKLLRDLLREEECTDFDVEQVKGRPIPFPFGYRMSLIVTAALTLVVIIFL